MRRYETQFDVRWYLLEKSWGTIQVVKHKEVDREQDFHDHDRGYLDIVLRGGYTEVRRDKGLKSSIQVNFFNKRDAQGEHKITQFFRKPTWVLKFQGRKRTDHATLDEEKEKKSGLRPDLLTQHDYRDSDKDSDKD